MRVMYDRGSQEPTLCSILHAGDTGCSSCGVMLGQDILGTLAPLRRLPVDILSGHLDVTGLTVNAAMRTVSRQSSRSTGQGHSYFWALI
jgi:hypothetical protein